MDQKLVGKREEVVQRKTEPLAIWALALGVLGIFGFSIILGIPAVICGVVARRRIRNGSDLNGKGMAFAGVIMGSISIVIFIISVIIFVTFGLPLIQSKTAITRAEAEIAALSAAMESYKADTGDYPTWTNNPGGNNVFLLTLLMPESGKDYFIFNKGMTNTNGIVDPFGTTYGYTYPGATNRNGSNSFDLWSTAGSTTNSTNAPKWIKNW
ncbi:MAG: DUF4190 domain-containing protein [Verrucomicrobiae bacterium]